MALYCAILGVTRALGVEGRFGVLASNQVCSKEGYAGPFTRAYEDFYWAIGAQPHRAGFLVLPGPVVEKPLTSVVRWHRRRTRRRRTEKRQLTAAVRDAWLRASWGDATTPA